MRRRPEPLQAVGRRAVAQQAQHRPVGPGQLHPQGAAQPPAQRPAAVGEVAGRVAQDAQPLQQVPVGGDRLLHHRGPRRQRPRQRRHQDRGGHRPPRPLRLDLGQQGLALGGAEGGAAPDGGPRRGGPLGGQGVGQQGVELLQPAAGVADQADLDRVVLADLPRVAVQVDQPDVLGDRPGRLAVDVEPQDVQPDGQDHVEVGQRPADLGRPVGQDAGVERVVGRHRQPAVRRRALGEDRRPQPLGDGRQGVRGPGLGDPAARQDRRPVGAGQEGGGPPQRLERRADAAVGDVGRGQVEPVGGLHLHVERQGEEDRAGRRRQGDLDRPPGRGRDVLHPPDLGGPLGPGAGHGDQVGGQDRLLEQTGGGPAGRRSAAAGCPRSGRCRACPGRCPARRRRGRWPRPGRRRPWRSRRPWRRPGPRGGRRCRRTAGRRPGRRPAAARWCPGCRRRAGRRRRRGPPGTPRCRGWSASAVPPVSSPRTRPPDAASGGPTSDAPEDQPQFYAHHGRRASGDPLDCRRRPPAMPECCRRPWRPEMPGYGRPGPLR